MRSILILILIITSSSFTHLIGQSAHSFTLEPTVKSGTALYSFSGMYTPNGKDFFSRSHGNYIPDRIFLQFDEHVHSWGSIGYMRKISERQNGSFYYGQVSIEFHETNGALGLRGGLGWMKSLGRNMFLDVNLNYNYQSSDVNFPNEDAGPAHLLQLPINLTSFLTFDDFKVSSFDLNESKWRIRKHLFGFIFNSWRSFATGKILSLQSDLNIGYRLQKWLIIEGIFKGNHDFFATSSLKTTFVRYGLGVSIQPYKWKRLIPTAGISLESDYHSSILRSFLPFTRKANVLVSDYYIGLEYRLNRHFSISLQYTAPVFEVPSFIPTHPQLELGTVYQF